jgi:threonine aldolase
MKNRFIAVQFRRLLQDELWREIATHGNELAGRFVREIEERSEARFIFSFNNSVEEIDRVIEGLRVSRLL